jgi:hypothetical protein
VQAFEGGLEKNSILTYFPALFEEHKSKVDFKLSQKEDLQLKILYDGK